ncbi:solute carrier family 2, facilitated glucose transporter member 5-like isoform X6 [Hemicordylus capensis]|uniref:solute carrier family 2, facilitated glucose transporter member 5-like isoform X6 n=1 Tax=Hemicordylus capensis TaxID=884348 RepID=UPI0023029AC5|nr:solute carrier family 2, facilitated glucose transporter member 5-like isoform X6 [Hemicordylus capensis]
MELERQNTKKKELTKSLLLLTLIVVSGSFQYGYNLWMVNDPDSLQQDFQNITYEKDKAKVGPNGNILMFLLAVTIAIFPIGALVGSLLIGLLVDRFGRKRTLLINDLLAIFSAICLGCSDVVNSHGFTIFARFGTGMCSALKKLRDQDDVEEEMEEIRQEYHYEREEKQINVSKLLCFKSLRRQLLCIVILKAGQELSGINAAYFYMREIFLSTGAGEHNSWYSHFSTACFLIFSQAFAMYVIDSWGRRFLLLVGFGSCSILCILLTMTIQLKDTISWMPYINMCFGILLVGAHMFGPNLVPNLMITELFLQSSRSSAYAIGGCVRWFFNFLNGFTILHVYNQIGTYIFLVYFPFSAGCFLYILKFVPETKKKTFLEIRRLMEMHIAKEKLVKAAVQ